MSPVSPPVSSSGPQQLGPQDVTRVARLARLSLDDTETAAMVGHLNRILGLIAEMNAVDTLGVAPMAHPRDDGLRLRADEVSESDRRDRFLVGAPASDAGLFLVPKVIE